jgi:hypothetical protein
VVQNDAACMKLTRSWLDKPARSQCGEATGIMVKHLPRLGCFYFLFCFTLLSLHLLASQMLAIEYYAELFRSL